MNAAAPWTANLSVARKLPAGTAVQVVARHDATASVPLEPAAGSFVHIDLAGA